MQIPSSVPYFLQFCRALTPIAWGHEERQEEEKGFLPRQELGEVHHFKQEGYNSLTFNPKW